MDRFPWKKRVTGSVVSIVFQISFVIKVEHIDFFHNKIPSSEHHTLMGSSDCDINTTATPGSAVDINRKELMKLKNIIKWNV